jgi:hypothetical protein
MSNFYANIRVPKNKTQQVLTYSKTQAWKVDVYKLIQILTLPSRIVILWF